MNVISHTLPWWVRSTAGRFRARRRALWTCACIVALAFALWFFGGPGFDATLLAALAGIGAATWLHLAIEWIDRHAAWREGCGPVTVGTRIHPD